MALHVVCFTRAPASHLTSFLILHELTAILPLPAIYYTLQATQLQVPIPPDVMIQAEEKMEKVMRRYGWLDEKSEVSVGDGPAIPSKTRMLVDMATSYAIVKLLMPVRLGLSLVLTPWFARTTVLPVRNGVFKLMGRVPPAP
ncbi:hypothetical protein BDR26DRAFT_857971 [Obelidium mucronatum]|nr:hypothetical protein BDR26DRAFT_857971 [Obelidium mucronatum]